jgi:hypothetical protein
MAASVWSDPGTGVMIFKIFSPKKMAKKLVFSAETKLNHAKNSISTLLFCKNAIFSQKIVENGRKF